MIAKKKKKDRRINALGSVERKDGDSSEVRGVNFTWRKVSVFVSGALAVISSLAVGMASCTGECCHTTGARVMATAARQ